MLLIHKMQIKVVFVLAQGMADAAFPWVVRVVERTVQKVQTAFPEKNPAVLTLEQTTL